MEDALRAVDLRPEEVLDRHPHQLSGGQRQRLMLARVYLMRPRLIVADEPVSMIDAGMRASFLNILQDFRDEQGISTLFITHDLSTAMYLGGEIIVLYQGRIMEQRRNSRRDEDATAPLRPAIDQLNTDARPAPPLGRGLVIGAPLAEIGISEVQRRERCLFADRCPQVMERCWRARPRLGAPRIDGAAPARRDVACYLYE